MPVAASGSSSRWPALASWPTVAACPVPAMMYMTSGPLPACIWVVSVWLYAFSATRLALIVTPGCAAM
jgi:hypothetical protein